MFRAAGPLIPLVRRIAVIRAGAVGDFIVTLPALEALAAAYPEAEIVLLGRPWQKEFLECRTGPVARVEVIPPFPGVGAPPDTTPDQEAVRQFFESMREERFDLALQLHGGGRHSNPFVRRLGARTTAGLRAADAPPLDRNLTYDVLQNEAVRALETVSLVGAVPVTLEPRLALRPRDGKEAAELVPEIKLERPLVLLHGGASDPRRRWHAEGFIAAGRALAAQGARVLVNGVGNERPLCEEIVRGVGPDALLLPECLSLGALCAVISQCRVVVTNDSGPLHLATAIGTPTVALHWGGSFASWAPLSRVRYRPIVSWKTRCSQCGASEVNARCGHDEPVLHEIPVDEVVHAALEFFPWPESHHAAERAVAS